MIYFYNLFQVRLPPEINRVLYIRNLPYKITAEEMYDIFGKYGAIRQIRVYVFYNYHLSNKISGIAKISVDEGG